MNQKITRASFLSLPSLESLPPIQPSLQLINSQSLLPEPTELCQLPLPFSVEEHSLVAPAQMQTVSSSSRKKRKGGCNCKKTLCLKMYCECFAMGRTCGQECSCLSCHNTEAHQAEILYAKSHVKESGIKNSSLGDKRCNCKKTQCTKRYCECYNAGVECSPACNCHDCHNMGQNREVEEEPNPEREPSIKCEEEEEGDRGVDGVSIDIFQLYLK